MQYRDKTYSSVWHPRIFMPGYERIYRCSMFNLLKKVYLKILHLTVNSFFFAILQNQHKHNNLTGENPWKLCRKADIFDKGVKRMLGKWQ